MLTGWGIVLAMIAIFAFFATRGQDRDEDARGPDAGLAIVEFGRAFPNEAIRSLHVTSDGRGVFVRLHDNKAGFMRNMGNHYACTVIEPGRVRVTPADSETGFFVAFRDAPFHDGKYVFADAAQAAEVSLWLLGNYVAPEDLQPNGSSARA